MLVLLQSEFKQIASEGDLASFAQKYGLIGSTSTGASNIYVGLAAGQSIEVRERWWDPSSVYSVQRDEHEVILLIENVETSRIRFTGNS